VRIVIVGLPLFAKRLKEGLTRFDPHNKYIHLDTYYNKKDKIKARLQIPRADCVFSINGNIEASGVFDLAFKKNIPLVMNWVGTDVLKAIDAYKNSRHQQHYIDKAIHFCEVEWIKEELKVIGIDAEVRNFAAFDKTYELKEVVGDKLRVLSYIPEIRSDFYGMPTIIQLAQKFPEMEFAIAGTEGLSYQPLPENLKALGWVKDMDAVYQETHVCIRYTEHDGLSTFILEALARGKQVLYNNPYDHCVYCPNETLLETQLTEMTRKLAAGESLINREGAIFIKNQFNEECIFGDMIKKITEIVKNR
jgi:glycosyltransferase involved in cell wall biosynthesis